MNTPPTPRATAFTPAQWQTLDTLRQRYGPDHDLFSKREPHCGKPYRTFLKRQYAIRSDGSIAQSLGRNGRG